MENSSIRSELNDRILDCFVELLIITNDISWAYNTDFMKVSELMAKHYKDACSRLVERSRWKDIDDETEVNE